MIKWTQGLTSKTMGLLGAVHAVDYHSSIGRYRMRKRDQTTKYYDSTYQQYMPLLGRAMVGSVPGTFLATRLQVLAGVER